MTPLEPHHVPVRRWNRLSTQMTKQKLGEVGEQGRWDSSLDRSLSNHPARLPPRSWSLVLRLWPVGWVTLSEPLSISDP